MRITVGTFSRFLLVGGLLLGAAAHAESKTSEYPGVSVPFADPAQYEFAEEEKEDKEFFHLGRFMMIGLDLGAGIFTGGLGTSAAPGFLVGGRLIYFFDRAVAFEGGVTYSNHLDQPRSSTAGLDIDTNMIGILAGFRYHFDTKAAPRAIAIANPYLSAGGGVFMRDQHVLQASGITTAPTLLPSTNFTVYGGGGVQFLVYRGHVYLGVDIRYNLVFFQDETTTLSGLVPQGDRAGDYLTTALTVTYSF
jgi:hypothetical protein